MTDKLILAGSILCLVASLALTPSVFASEDIAHMNKVQRPAINEEFDPDFDCIFDVFQLKCVPGSQQECPEGFSAGDPENCYPISQRTESGSHCPKGYHSTDDDETGQCYSNDNGCESDTLIFKRIKQVVWNTN